MLSLEDFKARVADRLLQGSALQRIPEWLCTNTQLRGAPWSFDKHEFQVAICEDSALDLVCMKCAQVGLSELQARMTLALMALKTGFTAIYVLPTQGFAQKFAKGRFDPIILQSNRLSSLVTAGSNGSELKIFGLSALYIGGAATDNQAISVPADALIEDEYDFCNPLILGKLESRLQHAENGGYRRKFSTPTLPGYGISGLYEDSSRGRYWVKCEHCNRYVCPEFHENVVIPGFNKAFSEFDKEDILNSRYDVDSAYISCKNCGKSLETSLRTPSRRLWVHASPEATRRGYSVRPFDLPHYNPTPTVIKRIENYERRQDYENFVHGLPYKSKHTEIEISTVKNCTVLDVVHEGEGFYIGVDVGKTVHVTVGKKRNGVYGVVKYMTFNVRDDDLISALSEVFKTYRAYRMVIDSQPDFSLSQALISRFGEYINPCIYLKDSTRKTGYYEVKEDENNYKICYTQRTKAFDSLCRDVNEGRFEFPKCEEMQEVMRHFGGMKRAEQVNEEGERVSKWVKIPNIPDHYLHSTMYFKLACDIDNADEMLGLLPAPTSVMGAKVNINSKSMSEVAEMIRAVRV